MRTRSRALIMAATTLTLTASAPALAYASQKNPCDVGNINNGAEWTAYNANHTGHAHFHEYDEVLEVVDTKSNGRRTEVIFMHCRVSSTGSAYYEYASGSPFDSGADEGIVDREWYDLSYYEGRKIHFKVCETDSDGVGVDDCGEWVVANA